MATDQDIAKKGDLQERTLEKMELCDDNKLMGFASVENMNWDQFNVNKQLQNVKSSYN